MQMFKKVAGLASPSSAALVSLNPHSTGFKRTEAYRSISMPVGGVAATGLNHCVARLDRRSDPTTRQRLCYHCHIEMDCL